MMSIGTFIFDIILITLLAATIFYCIRLNRHLTAIRDSKSEMAELIKNFSETTESAKSGMEELKISSKKILDALNSRIEKAGFVTDDLKYLVDKANRLADGLENGVVSGNKVRMGGPSPVAAKSISPKAVTSADEAKGVSKAEKELMEALKSIR